MHEYCNDVMKGAYKSCLVLQTLGACRELRRKALLFPKDPKTLIIGQGIIPEHIPGALLEEPSEEFKL